MAENTPNIALYLKNPLTDGSDTFNIETMLNENFRKIDSAILAEKPVITVTGDLDNYKQTGNYHVPINIPNSPVLHNSFFMEVVKDGNLVLQKLYGRVNPNLFYMRRFNSTWSTWDNLSKGLTDGVASQETLTTHLAESVSYVTYVTRDISIAGEQIISLLANRTPKSVKIYSSLFDTTCLSIGVSDGVNTRCISQRFDGKTGDDNKIVNFATAASTVASVNITFESGQIKLLWAKLGMPIGTAVLSIEATYHD